MIFDCLCPVLAIHDYVEPDMSQNGDHYTLNSVTGSGHVKCQEKPLACKLHGSSAWKFISFYLLYLQLYIWMPSGHVLIMCMPSCIIHDEHIFLSLGKDLHGQSSCHLYTAFQMLQNMASGHVKVKKRDWPCILHGHSQSRYWEWSGWLYSYSVVKRKLYSYSWQ